jgi:hypothetical protein
MKRLFAATLSVVSVLAFVQSASAATFSDTAKLSPPATVTVDQSLIADFNVGAEFASISSVCLYFKFTRDLLDPGDLLLVAFLENGEEIGGGGFSIPIGSTRAQKTRTLCYVPEFHPETVSLFLDGSERVKLVMESGSVMITRLRLTITGVPT